MKMNDPWADQQQQQNETFDEEEEETKVPGEENKALIKGTFAMAGLMFKGAAEFLLDLVK